MEDFYEDMATIDEWMYEANLLQYRADGISPVANFDAKKMCNAMAEPRGQNGTHRSASWAADNLGYTLKKEVVELDDEPFIIRDRNNVTLLVNLPGAFNPVKVQAYMKLLKLLAVAVKLSTCQADKKGCSRGYIHREGHVEGCVNMAYAWVPLLKPKTAQAPSAGIINGGKTPSVTKTAVAFASIQQHLKDTRFVSTLLNYILYRVQPDSFWAYVKASSRLRQKIPAAVAVATHDPALSSGKSVIYNWSTHLHFNNKEAPEGWSILVVMGDCTTGFLSLPWLGIKFKYLPGSVVLLRGGLLDHEVVGWDGEGDRICIAHFNHIDEWSSVNVSPPL
ncbi:hypothetical protein FRC12_003362 [Ceratobasidium sp. 428]|nr:hypothetical protein FRC12_003362 [Ceratobasidium sp. 428]